MYALDLAERFALAASHFHTWPLSHQSAFLPGARRLDKQREGEKEEAHDLHYLPKQTHIQTNIQAHTHTHTKGKTRCQTHIVCTGHHQVLLQIWVCTVAERSFHALVMSLADS